MPPLVDVSGGKVTVTFPAWTVGEANTFRKALLQSTTALSAEAEIVSNTTSFCDEVISQRVALLPLRRAVGVGTTISLQVEGPAVVLASTLITSDGVPAVAAAAERTMLALVAEGERLALTARVRAGLAREHCRYNHIVAPRVIGGSGERVAVVFETLSLEDDVHGMVEEAWAAVVVR